MKTLSTFALLVTAIALAACGGGSGGSGGDPIASGSRPSFAQLTDRGEYLADRLTNMSATPIDSMPTSGTASYLGVAGFVPEDAGSELLAVADMTADFENSTFAGTFTDFRDEENARVQGRINIRNGTITDNEVSADLRGNLVMGGQDERVTGTMVSVFGGPGAEAMLGVMEAQVGNRDYVGAVVGN